MSPAPLVLPVAEWAPDMPAFQNPGCGNVRNVIPRTPTSYGPLSDLAPYSTPLANRCQGAAACLDSGGNVSLFAGDVHDLYALTGAGASWSTVSKTLSHPYGTSSDGTWSFLLFGSRVIASNFVDPLQSYLLGSSTQFGDLAAAAPRCRYTAVVRNFLVAAHTSDPVSGTQPQRVWWSALNDPTNWPTPGTAAAAQVQSDYNDLLGAGGWIQGIVGNLGTADGAVFMERAARPRRVRSCSSDLSSTILAAMVSMCSTARPAGPSASTRSTNTSMPMSIRTVCSASSARSIRSTS